MEPRSRCPDASGCSSRCSSCTSRQPRRWSTPRSPATARRRNSPCACSPSPGGERCRPARRSAMSANPMQERRLLPKNRVVAVFDLDGTLTFGDSLFPFLRFLAGTRAFVLRLPFVFAILAAMVLRFVPRKRAKELVLQMFLRGRSRADLERQGERFARERLPAMLRPQASARLRWHQSRGHHSVVATASLAIYVAPWADAAGFDDVLATELEYDAHGCATGRILGENCRGEEKLRRLEERLGELSALALHGYGDSPADRAFLAHCSEAHYRPFRGVAAPAGPRDAGRPNPPSDFLRLIPPHPRVKNVVILDVFVIAAGFILRILAGTLGIGIAPSQWLLVCSLFLTLFLGFTKRRSELLSVGTEFLIHRKALLHYNPQLLDKMIGVCAGAALMSYSLYTMSPTTVRVQGTENLIYTIPFVAYGIFRYLFLLHAKHAGTDTSRELARDPHLLATLLGWAA